MRPVRSGMKNQTRATQATPKPKKMNPVAEKGEACQSSVANEASRRGKQKLSKKGRLTGLGTKVRFVRVEQVRKHRRPN